LKKLTFCRKYSAGIIDGSASGVKVAKYDEFTYKFVVAIKSNPDGSMYNKEKAPKKTTSGRVYDSNFVRHWDQYVTAQRNALWYGELTQRKNSSSPNFALKDLTNALRNTKLESPIPPFGGSGDYDVSKYGLAFVAKDPNLDPSTHTKQNLYILDWHSEKLRETKTLKFDGATSHPTFSPDGRSLAFLAMIEDGYEADKNQLMVISDIMSSNFDVVPYFATADNKGSWDRSPHGIVWSKSSTTLYLTADNIGNTGLYVASPEEAINAESPKLLRSSETIQSITELKDGTLFVTANNFTDSSFWYIFDPKDDGKDTQVISSFSSNGKKFGLSSDQVDQIWWEGGIQDIHAWVLKPSNFDESKKYPLAYLIHGGPQGAWGNGWSTRWNPAIFAEQGYVVVCPNPTGSTGYGQSLTDGIQNEWGGVPYNDLVSGFEYIENNLDYVDTERAVALGASYGG
jgi:dipeptidyl aminopeptidase/acylaminoacyl peptidase